MSRRAQSNGAIRSGSIASSRPRLIAYLPDPAALRHLHRCLTSVYDVIPCLSQRDVVQKLAIGVIDVLVLDCRAEDGTSTLEFVRRTRQRYASVAIVLYATPISDFAHELVQFSHAGLEEVVLRGADDWRRVLLRTVADAADVALSRYTMSILEPLLTPQVADVVRTCLSQREDRLDVTGLARAQGVTRKTLANWCSVSNAPNPESLIGWSRVLRAARMLEDRGRSVETVAHATRFGSANALTNMFRRYVGESPSAIRPNGGVKRVVEKWASVCGRSID
ncbi:MAG: helix-turn-helix domain-containing protein [Gemmatimonadaceae bacterium]